MNGLDNYKLQSDREYGLGSVKDYELDYKIEFYCPIGKLDELVANMKKNYGATDFDVDEGGDNEEGFCGVAAYGIYGYESDGRADDVILQEMAYSLEKEGYDVIEFNLW